MIEDKDYLKEIDTKLNTIIILLTKLAANNKTGDQMYIGDPPPIPQPIYPYWQAGGQV